MKHLIFDSGPLINFSMNGALHVLERLNKEFKGDFLITKEVKEEKKSCWKVGMVNGTATVEGIS